MEWVHADLELMLITDTWYDVAEALWRVATIMIMKLGGKSDTGWLKPQVFHILSSLVSASGYLRVYQSVFLTLHKVDNRGYQSFQYSRIETVNFHRFTQQLYKPWYWSLYVLLGPTLVWECHDFVHREVGFKEDFRKCNQHAE